jgi:hypothetical protein
MYRWRVRVGVFRIPIWNSPRTGEFAARREFCATSRHNCSSMAESVPLATVQPGAKVRLPSDQYVRFAA